MISDFIDKSIAQKISKLGKQFACSACVEPNGHDLTNHDSWILLPWGSHFGQTKPQIKGAPKLLKQPIFIIYVLNFHVHPWFLNILQVDALGRTDSPNAFLTTHFQKNAKVSQCTRSKAAAS